MLPKSRCAKEWASTGPRQHTEKTSSMSITEIRFTSPQIGLLRRAHPGCNLEGLVELIFFFDQSGHLLDCVGKITGDGSERHCVGLGLTLMYEMACRSFAGRSERPAEILQFPK